jgi:hypothetical protein
MAAAETVEPITGLVASLYTVTEIAVLGRNGLKPDAQTRKRNLTALACGRHPATSNSYTVVRFVPAVPAGAPIPLPIVWVAIASILVVMQHHRIKIAKCAAPKYMGAGAKDSGAMRPDSIVLYNKSYS